MNKGLDTNPEVLINWPTLHLVQEVERLRAERDALAARVKALREALSWIDVVNAMDYEYRRHARTALLDDTKLADDDKAAGERE